MRPAFAFRFRKWVRVLATGRLLLFRVGSRYLEAISSRQEDRELQKEEMEMADQVLDYGDGVNWRGIATVSAKLFFRVEFANVAQEVHFPVSAGQGSLDTATKLKTYWNDNWLDEASMPKASEPCVEFTKPGQKVTSMQVKAGDGEWKDLPTAVNGFTVTRC